VVAHLLPSHCSCRRHCLSVSGWPPAFPAASALSKKSAATRLVEQSTSPSLPLIRFQCHSPSEQPKRRWSYTRVFFFPIASSRMLPSCGEAKIRPILGPWPLKEHWPLKENRVAGVRKDDVDARKFSFQSVFNI
jgi:hypothetical protein